MKQTISQTALNDLFAKYSERGGMIFTIPGCLLDNYILVGDGLKTFIIRETYLNEWSSANTIRSYNKLPKKYDKITTLLADGEHEQAAKLFFGS